MKRFVSMLTVLALAMCATIAVAESAPKKEKPAAPAVPTIKGEVTKVDASSITVKNKEAEKTFTIDANTKIKAGSEDKTAADIKVGDKVTVKYDGDKAVGIMIAAPKPAGGEHKKKDGAATTH